jgi:ABC-type multidrug transport system fused ATPase/permease subunit
MLGLQNQQFHQKYYSKITNLMDIESKIQFREIDFDKPWWQVYGWAKFKNIAILLTVIGESGFLTALPLILVQLLKTAEIQNYILILVLALSLAVLFLIGYYLSTVWECIVSNNIVHCANSYFLKVDPIYHTTKNSGQIISKIERATTAYLDFDIGLVFNILPNIIGILVGSIALFYYNWQVGIAGLFSSIVILAISVYLRVFNNIVFRKKVIEVEDKSKSLTVENLSQMIFIRSAFATLEQISLSSKLSKDSAAMRGTFWTTSAFTDMFLFFVQVCFALAITYYISNLIRFQGFDLINGVAALTTYLGGTSRVVGFGSNIKRLIEAEYKIRDLFLFIRTFGKQTFPVE